MCDVLSCHFMDMCGPFQLSVSTVAWCSLEVSWFSSEGTCLSWGSSSMLTPWWWWWSSYSFSDTAMMAMKLLLLLNQGIRMRFQKFYDLKKEVFVWKEQICLQASSRAFDSIWSSAARALTFGHRMDQRARKWVVHTLNWMILVRLVRPARCEMHHVLSPHGRHLYLFICFGVQWK